MHDPWTHLRDVYDRAMGNLERKEATMARSHLHAVAHTAETIGRKAAGDERERAGRIYSAARKAEHTIDMQRALDVLREAQAAFLPTPQPPTNL
jgi:hypothetical protein